MTKQMIRPVVPFLCQNKKDVQGHNMSFSWKNTQQHENKRTSKTNKEIIIGKIATSKTNQMKTTMMAFLCHHIKISGIKQ